MFSLGLCVLEAGLMRGIQTIYDDMNGQFLDHELEAFIDEFANKYQDNPLLITTVRKMLEINEAARPDFINIKNAIPPYEEVCDYFEHLRGQNHQYEEDLTDPYLIQGHHGQQSGMQGSHNQYGGNQLSGMQGSQGNQYGNQHNNQQSGMQGHQGNQYGGGAYDNHNSFQNESGYHDQYAQPNPPQQQQSGYNALGGMGQQNYNQSGYPKEEPVSQSPLKPQNTSSYNQGSSGHQSQPIGGSNLLNGGLNGINQQSSHGNSSYPSPYARQDSNPIPVSSHQHTPEISSGGEKTKMIDGKMFKEVSETKTEVNDQGQTVRRIYVRYVPCDGSDAQPSYSNVSNGGYSNTVQGGQSYSKPTQA